MKKLLLLLLSVVVLAGNGHAGSYNYVTAEEFKGMLESGKPMVLVDIQVADEFKQHHFKNSIETNAFPVETDVQRKSIDPGVAAFKQSGHDVVVICPRGGGGAKKTYDYLKENGVPEEKLTILKGGVEKWPFKEMLEKSAGTN